MKNKQQQPIQLKSAADEPMHARLRTLIGEALRAQPYSLRERPGFPDDPVAIKQPLAKGLSAFLATETLPALFDEKGELVRTPKASPAATAIRLEAGLIANSRLAQAGAHVFVHADPTTARPTGLTGLVVMESKPVAFHTIEAAKFETVDVDSEADVTLSALPVSRANIDFEQAIAKAVRFELPRSARKDVDEELLCAEIVAAMTLGLSRAADEVLLTAIVATTPGNFSMARAAAQGLKWGELRAIVGRSANGATVSEDGTLRAGGVPAELTADTASTIVGAFSRAGVAIGESVDVYFERTSKSGLLAVTAWASMLALVPDASKFWVVPAEV